MCLCELIASDKPLALVPWDAQRGAFNTVPLHEHEEAVRRRGRGLRVLGGRLRRDRAR
jgi:hypothetical protein